MARSTSPSAFLNLAMLVRAKRCAASSHSLFSYERCQESFPELEPTFKQVGRLMIDVGILVAEQCDRLGTKVYSFLHEKRQQRQHLVICSVSRRCLELMLIHAVEKKLGQRQQMKLVDLIRGSRLCKGVLHHYLPINVLLCENSRTLELMRMCRSQRIRARTIRGSRGTRTSTS